jgi:hypothetical protein
LAAASSVPLNLEEQSFPRKAPHKG